MKDEMSEARFRGEAARIGIQLRKPGQGQPAVAERGVGREASLLVHYQ